MIKSSSLIAALLCSAAGVALATGAEAQTAQEPTSTVSDVVVTATRNARLLKDVPLAVDVATGEQLEQLSILDAKDVQQLAPGLTMTNKDGRSNTATLRGIAYDPDSGTAPSVDIYFNENPVDPQLIMSAIYDIGQIEILRGPQGVLRGRTAPGGAITMVSRQPSLDGLEGYVQATATDQDATNFQGGVSVPLVTDRLGVRLAFLDDRNPVNGVHNVIRNDDSEGHTQSFRLSLLAKPTDAVTVNLAYQRLESEDRQYPQVIGTGAVLPEGPLPDITFVPNGPAAGPADRISVTDGPATFDREYDLLTFGADWTIGSGSLSLNASKMKGNLDQRLDYDIGNAVPNYDEYQELVIPYDNTYLELRYASDLAGPLNFQVGANFQETLSTPVTVHQRTDTLLSGLPAFMMGLPAELGVISTFPLYTISPVIVDISSPTETRSTSAFASVTYDLSDRLQFNGGLRYTRYKSYQQSFLTVDAGGAVVLDGYPTLPEDKARRTVEAVTGGASLVYKFTDAISAYGSYGRSFRAGSAAVGNTAPLDDNLVITDDEISDAFEIGLKGNMFDRRMSFTVNAFYQTFDNYIARTPEMIRMASGRNGIIDSVLKVNYNADAIVKGIEATVWGKPSSSWDISASASYTDAQFDGGARPCNQVNGAGDIFVPIGQQASFCDATGKMGDQSPFQLSANSEYRLAPMGSLEPFIRGLVTYSPGFDSDLIDYEYDALALVNLYLGVRSEQGWELSIFAKNLFDETAVRSAADGNYLKQTSVLNPDFTLSPGPSLNSGYRQVSVNTPREIGVSLRVSF
ncbi:MAG: TonB-dependent receptor [Candidatus Brevundimonas phytovorans]|nr:TonB-dependent receptor [Brevundimonas sp.]WEK56734.1 MAG: TonB-dependent receptor [Brevundimonas sp.]